MSQWFRDNLSPLLRSATKSGVVLKYTTEYASMRISHTKPLLSIQLLGNDSVNNFANYRSRKAAISNIIRKCDEDLIPD